MASDTNSTLPKVRTFAQDAERVKKTEPVKNEPAPKNDTEIPKQKESKQPEKPTKKEPSLTKIPPPPEVTHEEETDEADIPNPPLHTLKKNKKKESVSHTPVKDRALQDAIDTADIEKYKGHTEDEQAAYVSTHGSEDARIISDKKRAHKSVWQSIVESTGQWFTEFKERHISPSGPTYTVSPSERRAGILTSATTKSGAANVSRDDFAARLKARFAKENEGQGRVTDQVDPIFLPELPAPQNKQQRVTEVETIPRKSHTAKQPTAIASTQTNTVDSTNTVEISPEKTTASPQQEAVVNTPVPSGTSQEVAVKSDDSPKPTLDEMPTKQPASIPVHPTSSSNKTVSDQVADERSETKNSVGSSQDVSQEETSTPAPASLGNDITNIADTIPPPEPIPATEIAATDSEPVATPEPRDPSFSTTNAGSEEIGELPIADADSYQDTPTDTPDSAQTEYIETSGDTETNRLSSLIVIGIIGCTIVGYILFTLFQQHNTTEEIDIAFTVENSVTKELPLAAYPDSTARFAAIVDIIEQTTTGRIVQIVPMSQIPERSGEASVETIFNAFAMQTPTNLQDVVTSLYFGGTQEAQVFVLMTVEDRNTARGELLRWESRMPAQLAPLFGINSSRFQDITRNGYDLRVTTEPGMTYGFYENILLITTTPAAWTEIVQLLP